MVLSVQQLVADLLNRQINCQQLAAYLAKKIKQSHQDSKMFAEMIRSEVCTTACEAAAQWWA